MGLLAQNDKKKSLLLIALMSFLLFFLGYFTARSNFLQLILLYGFSFVAYLLFLKINLSEQKNDWKLWLLMALVLRLLLLGMQPNLSDDFFRYIWDGRLLTHHYNPFDSKPESWLDDPLFLELKMGDLYYGNPDSDWFYYEGLNSKAFYSVYPTTNQMVFGFAAWLFPTNAWASIVVIRCCLILAELGTLLFTASILRKLKMKSSLWLIYAFNPLVIMELSGNLHCETLAIFFIVGAIWALLLPKYSILFSSVFFSFAITAKLLPVIFLPLIYTYLGFRRGTYYMLLTGMCTIILLFPFFYDISLLLKLGESVRLYFSYFEFNASFYYLSKYFVSLINNDPPKELIATMLNIGVLVFVLYLAFFRRAKNIPELFSLMLFAFTAYCLATRTVHPWYISPLVLFSLFTRFRYALLWSGLIYLSYYPYSTGDYSESIWLLLLEYGALAAWIYKERMAKT